MLPEALLLPCMVWAIAADTRSKSHREPECTHANVMHQISLPCNLQTEQNNKTQNVRQCHMHDSQKQTHTMKKSKKVKFVKQIIGSDLKYVRPKLSDAT